MGNKEIQEERMKGYFIDAAKDLIRAEGVGVVSTRSVAQRAGYSYATLYNYFKDIRDLIFSCIEDFMKECKSFVEQDYKENESFIENLNQISISYSKFFVQYPGIFDLFFIEKVQGIATPGSHIERVYEFFDNLCDNAWIFYENRDQNDKKKILAIRENYKFALHGLLLFYLSRRKNFQYTEFIERVKNLSVDFVSSLN